MAGVGRADSVMHPPPPPPPVVKYVEGCQPGHWACGLTHTGQRESDSAKGTVVAGAQVWLVPGATLQEWVLCLVPRSGAGSRHCPPLPYRGCSNRTARWRPDSDLAL